MDTRKPREPWWDRLNRTLFPHMGPAQVGPYDEPPAPPEHGGACPLCGAPMDEHVIERGQGHQATRLHCPAVNR